MGKAIWEAEEKLLDLKHPSVGAKCAGRQCCLKVDELPPMGPRASMSSLSSLSLRSSRLSVALPGLSVSFAQFKCLLSPV